MRARVTAILIAMGALALAPQVAQAAYVTAVDTSVRPAEGSPWSKGTLFQGQGFQVGATTGNGWAWGRAKGEAERCGWVLLTSLNPNPALTDATCGAPRSEPLEDSEHVLGGGASETWYVTCQSATLFGNYGGAAGNLRSPSGGVSYGQAVNWHYTTGNGYAASVDGPFNTPRFILRSCISRTPPGGGGGPGPGPSPGDDAELIGPPPWRLMDEEGLFAIFGPGRLSSASAFASGKPRVARSRVTIRLAQGNIVIANGLEGDRFDASGVYCKGWVLGTVDRDSRPFTGWVQRSAFRPLPRRSKRDCHAPVKFDDRIGWVNAPFHSITWLSGRGKWSTTGSASQSRLRRQGNAVAPDCGLYMNYNTAVQGAARFQDPVTPALAKNLFTRPEQAQTKDIIGYRYTSPGGDAALVSVKTGFKKTMIVKRHGKKHKVTKNVGLWSFVKRDCVVPLSAYSPKPDASRILYMPQIRVCKHPSDAVKKFNKRKPRSKRLHSVAPCRYANSRTSIKKPVPDHPQHGWLIGDPRLGG